MEVRANPGVLKMRSHLWAFLLCGLSLPVTSQTCPVKPAQPPFQQEVSNADDHFEWYSAYAPSTVPGNGNDFDRHVKNMGSKLLKYEWAVGRMYNFALPPGQTDTRCVNYGRANSKRGPLYHGRLNDENDTSVWEGEGEPKSNTIVGKFVFFFSDLGGDPEITIILKSSFDGKSYNYSLKNTSKTTVRVSWLTRREVNLFEELGKGTPFLTVPFQTGQRPEEILADQLKKGRTLEPGQEITSKLESSVAPNVVSTNLDFGSLDGRPRAGVILPILAPGH